MVHINLYAKFDVSSIYNSRYVCLQMVENTDGRADRHTNGQTDFAAFAMSPAVCDVQFRLTV